MKIVGPSRPNVFDCGSRIRCYSLALLSTFYIIGYVVDDDKPRPDYHTLTSVENEELSMFERSGMEDYLREEEEENLAKANTRMDAQISTISSK